MSGWHDNLLMFRVGHKLGRLAAQQEEAIALLRELQNAKQAEPSKSAWIEYGRMAGKAIIPQLAPLVWAWVLALSSAMGAMAWAGWRILRGSMGF